MIAESFLPPSKIFSLHFQAQANCDSGAKSSLSSSSTIGLGNHCAGEEDDRERFSPGTSYASAVSTFSQSQEHCSPSVLRINRERAKVELEEALKSQRVGYNTDRSGISSSNTAHKMSGVPAVDARSQRPQGQLSCEGSLNWQVAAGVYFNLALSDEPHLK